LSDIVDWSLLRSLQEINYWYYEVCCFTVIAPLRLRLAYSCITQKTLKSYRRCDFRDVVPSHLAVGTYLIHRLT